MEVIISPLKAGIQLSTTIDVCEAESGKFKKNLNLIHTMELELNLIVSCHNDEHLLIVRNITTQICEKDIESFKNSVVEFMTGFSKIPFDESKQEDECSSHTVDEINFVKSLIEDKDILMISGAILCKDGYSEFTISNDVWHRLIDAYLEKYGEK